MITIFVTRERERRYRKLLAFSLLEVLIVVAIVGILSSIIVVKWQDMREIEQARQCKANMLEIASALQTKFCCEEFSSKTYITLNPKTCTEEHLPLLKCPLPYDKYPDSFFYIVYVNDNRPVTKTPYKVRIECPPHTRKQSAAYKSASGNRDALDAMRRKYWVQYEFEVGTGKAKYNYDNRNTAGTW